MRRFIDGLIFGAGFAVAFLTLSYIFSYFLYPSLMEHLNSSSVTTAGLLAPTVEALPTTVDQSKSTELAIPFHQLPLEKQIEGASAIVVTKFQSGNDGQQKAIVVEYVKGAPTANFPYRVGDEMADQSYYPKPNESRSDGEVVFYVGTPEINQMSFPYESDRLNAFGAMPLKLFREKCKRKPDA